LNNTNWSAALAIVELVGAYTPGGNFFQGRALLFGTTYYTMTIGLNIILTVLICARLLYFSRLMRAAFGTDEASSRLYSGIAAMLAESAAPYALVGIMFLIPYALQSQTADLFGQLYAKFAVSDRFCAHVVCRNSHQHRLDSVSRPN
jgi:hypothetical protein